MNIFQQLLQDAIGTQKGQALEAKAQPILNDLAPITQDLIGIATKNDPALGALIQNGEAVATAINNLTHGLGTTTTAVTDATLTIDEFITIVDGAFTDIGLPTTDDATLNAAIETRYTAWKASQGVA